MVRVHVPGSLRYRDLAVRAVAAASKLVGPGSRSFDDEVVSAFGEAFNNVAMHGFKGRTPGKIEIEIEIGGDWLTIRMYDDGASFDVDKVPEPDFDGLPESGMGLYIIKSFMDEVTYRAGDPNVLSMTKRYPTTKPGGTEAS